MTSRTPPERPQPCECMGEFLAACAVRWGPRTALTIRRGFRSDRLTYGALYDLSLKTAGLLRRHGIGKGDRIAIWASNMPEWAIALFGGFLAGAVVVPLDARFSLRTNARVLQTTRPKLMFRSRALAAPEGDLLEAVPHIVDIESLGSLADEQTSTGAQDVSVGPADPALIMFTSGATERPRGVVLTHGNLLSNLRAIVHVFPLDPDHRALSLLPLCHMLDQMVGLYIPLWAGLTVHYLERTHLLGILKTMQREKITCFVAVPRVLHLFLESIEAESRRKHLGGAFRLLLRTARVVPSRALRRAMFLPVHRRFGGRLDFIACGGAPLDTALIRDWEAMGVRIFEGYGTTEVTTAVAFTRPFKERVRSLGQPLPGVEVRIDDDDQILVRGPNVSPGYYEDAERTAEAFAGGWFKTGDAGLLDDGGALHLLGRTKFRIVLGSGLKVYPEDLEEKLRAHPLVAEACVFGLPGSGGERIHASLVLKDASKAAEVVEQVNRELEPHQAIREYSLWPEREFPRTRTLKIDRETVRQWRMARAAPPEPEAGLVIGDAVVGLICRALECPAPKVFETSRLNEDLGMDSLKTVLLLSLVESEMGVTVDETAIRPGLTVSEFRTVVRLSSARQAPKLPHTWTLAAGASAVREVLQRALLFPLLRTFVQIRVEGSEHFSAIRHPSILTFNHTGQFDAAVILKILPPPIRRKTVIAVMAEHWKLKFYVPALYLVLHTFRMTRGGPGVKDSIEAMADLLDRGWSVMIAPEGEVSWDGQLLPFKGGAAFVAQQMRVPVVPIRVEDYGPLYPRGHWVPVRRGTATVKIGLPFHLPDGIPLQAGTALIRRQIEDLERRPNAR